MKRYTIYKRKKDNESFFYVMFVDEDTGKRTSAKSVEALRKALGDSERHHITKRAEAEQIVIRAISKGLDGNEKKQDPLFADYLLTFWDYDNSPYVRKENLKNPDSIHRDYVSNRLSNVKLHVLPYLPKGLKCSQIKRKHLEKIQEHLVTEKSVSLWLSVKKSLSAPIRELRRKEILLIDPFFGMDTYAERTDSSVGTLTRREVEKLIIKMYQDMTEGRFVSVKKRGKAGALVYDEEGNIVYKDILYKLDPRVFLATALAFATGMRKGEIQALRTENVRFPNDSDKFEDVAIIDVMGSYARQQGFKGTKTNKTRQVPIPSWLAEDLIEFANQNPHDNGLVFWSDTNPEKPVNYLTLSNGFELELDQIGIGEKEREERHIVFHSARHYFDTMGVTCLGGEKTRLILGHSDHAMTSRYDTGNQDERVLEIGLSTLDFIPNPHTHIQTA